MPHVPASSALARFRVVDLTQVRAGPTACRQLADWGADVIQVQMPEHIRGDDTLGGQDSCRTPNAALEAPTFTVTTTPTAKQQRAFALLKKIQLQAAPGTAFSCQLPVVHGKSSAWTDGTSG